jgi:hypothetical protein
VTENTRVGVRPQACYPPSVHGLSRVSVDDLTRLLRIVHRGVVPFPITRASLVLCAFGHLEGELDLLVGLDQRGARALLVGVIAERREASRRVAR